MKNLNPQNGFTLVELMIATSVFSVLLLLLASMSVQIGKTYYKGVLTAQTQEAAREVTTEIVRSLQFTAGTITIPAPTIGVNYFCAGTDRYTYVLGKQLSDSGASDAADHVLVRDVAASCSGPADLATFDATKQHELIPKNMRLVNLQVNLSPNLLYSVTVRVVYGDGVLLCSPTITNDCTSTSSNLSCGLVPTGSTCPALSVYKTDLQCRGGKNAGTQYCAVSELSTSAQKRI